MMDEPIEDNKSGPALLLVAAKSLQSYVLGSDKVREMVGATQLIEDFCSDHTAQSVLEAMRIEDGEVLTGAAGQLTIRFDCADSAAKAAALWPWFAHRLAPGLEVHVGVSGMLKGGYRKAVDDCQQQIARSRNRPAVILPMASPPHARNPRSGLVAVETDKLEPDGPVLVDAAGIAKRHRRKEQNAEVFKLFALTNESITAESFDDITAGEGGERSYLGIIHADGNGFGEMLIKIGDQIDQKVDYDSVGVFQDISALIREVGEQAAESATEKMLVQVGQKSGEATFLDARRSRPAPMGNLPWLPIVLAGDDLTLVIRADLALDFIEAFIRSFEKASTEKLAAFGKKYPGLTLPERLTCGGSVVFCKTSHPFSEAYELCESLAKSRAKGNTIRDAANEPRSAVAFHRISASTSHTDFSSLQQAELLCNDGGSPHLKLIAAPWFIDESADEPFTFARLRALTNALRPFPSGSRRQLLAELRTSRNEAPARLRRMIAVHERAGDQNARNNVAALKSALSALHGSESALWRELPVSANPSGKAFCVSALPDALTFIEMTR